MPSIRKRIVLTTFGSLGDLHPWIAIARGLQSRGHDAVIATHASYRTLVKASEPSAPTSRTSPNNRP